MKSEVTARAAAMGYCSDQLNGVQEARRVKDKALTDRGVTLVSTTDGIDSSTPAGRMMIGVLGSSLAEYEREVTKERAALKRQASRANGAKFWRPRNFANTEHVSTANRMKTDGHTAKDIAKYLGVSRATVYRYLAEEPA